MTPLPADRSCALLVLLVLLLGLSAACAAGGAGGPAGAAVVTADDGALLHVEVDEVGARR